MRPIEKPWTRIWMRHAGISVLTVTLLGCAAEQIRPIPGGETVVGEAPSYVVGDEWQFTGGRFPGFVRIVAFSGDQVVTDFQGDDAVCDRCLYFRDRNLTTTKVVDQGGTPRPYAQTGLKILDFPLRVGKEWSQRIDLYSRGQLLPYFNRFRVEAYEEVTVKAGTFKAFRISWYQEGAGGGNLFKGTATRWWSPEVKWFVKFEPFSNTRGRSTELESYKLQQR